MGQSVGKRFGEIFGRGGIIKRILAIGCEGSGKPGTLLMEDEDGNDHYSFFDDDGHFRISTDTIPDADTDGVALPLLIKTDVTYADHGTVTLFTAQDGWCLSHVVIEVTSAWNASATIIVGISGGDTDGFFESADITDYTATAYYGEEADVQGVLLYHGAGSHSIKHIFTEETTVIATVNKNAEDVGAASIYCYVQKLKG